MRELSDKECNRLATDCGLPYATESERAMIRAGYAAGYRAAQAACAPRELACQCPNYGAMPPSLDHQPAATSVSDGATAAPSEATASVTDPAADPAAPRSGDRAALERLARERDDARRDVEQHYIRNKELRTERDVLHAIVRAADAMRRAETGVELAGATVAYDRARAAWKGES